MAESGNPIFPWFLVTLGFLASPQRPRRHTVMSRGQALAHQPSLPDAFGNSSKWELDYVPLIYFIFQSHRESMK